LHRIRHVQRRNLTEGTVKTHINHLYRKLDVRTRAQAVAKAQELSIG
jgi:ATP/maltotriose-dependent transcriptional regulator MalT